MNVIMGLSRVEKKFFGKNFCMMFEMLQASGDLVVRCNNATVWHMS